MRPKIVILTLLTAFAVLGVVALLKGVAGKNQGTAPEAVPVTPAGPAVASTDTNTASGGVPAVADSGEVSQQVRDAVIDKQIEEIQNLVTEVDGSNNPVILAAIIEKLSRPEAEVRKAALDAVRQLNDTNAVPGLQAAVNATADPRQKVAIMDTIDYLQLPNITDDAPPDMQTNYALMNFMASNHIHGARGHKRVQPPQRIGSQPAAVPDSAAQGQ